MPLHRKILKFKLIQTVTGNPVRLGVLASGRFSNREFFLQKCSVGLVTAIGHWNFLAGRISDIYGPLTRRLQMQTEVL